ncbi:MULTISPECIES: GPW/gp25 family protein [Acinetobacter]|uniref:GPW/gp25 family protein n=1 Tax=Acinetobacter TaxID=469 RepID=UPI00214F8C45|nr:GPW/gp25 family protein [Acinetobacter venetianus]MCR4529815.1 GPW/gp25 family protein [Acinetobacter venetianus]
MIGMSRTTGRSIDDATPYLLHLRQSIQDILTTLVGTRICRRNYGSIVPDLIDQPCNEATKVRLFSATATALTLFEPRVRISNIQIIKFEDVGIWELELVGTTTFNQRVIEYVDRFELRATA